MTKIKKMIEDAAPEIIERQLALAKKGNPFVSRYLLERILPVAKSAPIETPVALPGTPAEQAEAILAALAAGQITQDSAESLLHAVRITQEIRDASELQQRLADIEGKLTALAGAVSSPPALPAPKGARDAP